MRAESPRANAACRWRRRCTLVTRNGPGVRFCPARVMVPSLRHRSRQELVSLATSLPTATGRGVYHPCRHRELGRPSPVATERAATGSFRRRLRRVRSQPPLEPVWDRWSRPEPRSLSSSRHEATRVVEGTELAGRGGPCRAGQPPAPSSAGIVVGSPVAWDTEKTAFPPAHDASGIPHPPVRCAEVLNSHGTLRGPRMSRSVV